MNCQLLLFSCFLLHSSINLSTTSASRNRAIQRDPILKEFLPLINSYLKMVLKNSGKNKAQHLQEVKMLQYMLELRFRQRLQSWINKGALPQNYSWTGCRRCFNVI